MRVNRNLEKSRITSNRYSLGENHGPLTTDYRPKTKLVPFEFSPEKLVYGGDALGYHQGGPVLVPRALPGERLEVEPVRTAKGVVHARPLRVLKAAPERVDPPCPYFGHCGGCQYQHLSAQNQTVWKLEILRETLRRIGKIIWDAEIHLHAGHPWNYRNQAQLKVARQADGQVALGFFEAESHRLFPVDVCLILSPHLNVILGELRRREWSDGLAACQEIELLADNRDEEVLLILRGSFGRQEGEALAQQCLAQLPGVVSVGIERGRECQVFGKPTLTYSVGEFRYRITPGSFFQASRFLLPELVSAVVAPRFGATSAGVTGEESRSLTPDSRFPTPDSRTLALDLYAGVGLFTLPLARRFTEVVGVEAHAKSAADLAASARANALENVRPVAETAFDFLRRFAQTGPDLVVLDPPRAGVGASTLKFLAACRPKRIHYLSCSPPTLARDLGYLIARGYRLNSIELFDFFPQTYHIESLARLVRNNPSG